MEDRFKCRVFVKTTHTMLTDVIGVTFLPKKIWNKGECVEGVRIEYFDYFLNRYNIVVYPVKDIEIMQCTGKTDKNGKLIYESNIIKKVDSNALGYYRERICEVLWDKEYLYWYVLTSLGDGYSLSDFESNQLEVIGNIQENPEVLKVEE